MSFIKLVVNDIERFRRDMKQEQEKIGKAYLTAVKVEMYRLTGLLKKGLSEGRAGNVVFSPLTEMALRMSKAKRLRVKESADRKPLSRLSRMIRYHVKSDPAGVRGQIGFTDTLSTTSKRIAQFQQEGGTVPVTEDLRKGLIRMGAFYQKRKSPLAKYFFLKKGTQSLRTPGRDIIDTFWNAHEKEAERNIISGFERKMRGEQI